MARSAENAAAPGAGGMSGALADNIRRMSERRAAEAAGAPLSERVAARITDFTGSMRFVVLHLLLFGGWIAVNGGLIPGVPRFDPSFVVLAMVASVEAIFLSTFVLIAQNRMARLADRRADLDLHINLLAEHELTRLSDLISRIAERVGVDADAYREIRRDIAPLEVLDAIDRSEDQAGA